MGRTDPRTAASSNRRATDELFLARLLGVGVQPSVSHDAQADEQLLRALLLPPEAAAFPQRRSLRPLVLAFAAMLALLTGVPLALAAGSLLAIRNNVAAMRTPEVAVQPSEITRLQLQRRVQASSKRGQPVEMAARPRATSAAVAATAPRNVGDSYVNPNLPAAVSPQPPTVVAGGGPATLPPSIEPRAPAFGARAPAAPSSGSPQAPITVLLLGVDRRPEQTGPARADSVIVARIDPRTGRVALVSFPRDLQVEIPGVGWDRINAATVYGEMYPELGGSLDLARRTVETLLGIPIDHAVSVDFSGFISAVDALGGIIVDVEREVYDSYTENHFAAGPQHMDGRTALWYSRIRFLDSDFERMRRQQAVLLGLISRIREQNTLQQLQSIAAVTGALRGYIQTDLPEDQMVRLAWGFRNLAPEAVEQYRLEVDQVDIFVNAADPYAQYIRPGAVESLVRKLLGNTP